jgi:transcriptional regulator with XRE-family HTH domain
MEFARRLQAAMVRKGWNQSELARRASEHMPKSEARGSSIERSAISGYVKGKALPWPARLAAIAKALDVKETDLLPPELMEGGGAPEPSPFAMKDVGGGRMSLQINRTVSTQTAMAIVQLLAKEDQ